MQAFFYIFIQTIKTFKMRKLFITLLLIPFGLFSQSNIDYGVFSGIALYSHSDTGNIVVSLTSVPSKIKEEIALKVYNSLPINSIDSITYNTSIGSITGEILVDWRPNTTLINFVYIKQNPIIVPDNIPIDTLKNKEPIKPKKKFVDMQYAY